MCTPVKPIRSGLAEMSTCTHIYIYIYHCYCYRMQVYKVETAGDCYIVAGALMAVDEEGFMSLEDNPDPQQGADRVMAFSKVRKDASLGWPHGWNPTCCCLNVNVVIVLHDMRCICWASLLAGPPAAGQDRPDAPQRAADPSACGASHWLSGDGAHRHQAAQVLHLRGYDEHGVTHGVNVQAR